MGCNQSVPQKKGEYIEYKVGDPIEAKVWKFPEQPMLKEPLWNAGKVKSVGGDGKKDDGSLVVSFVGPKGNSWDMHIRKKDRAGYVRPRTTASSQSPGAQAETKASQDDSNKTNSNGFLAALGFGDGAGDDKNKGETKDKVAGNAEKMKYDVFDVEIPADIKPGDMIAATAPNGKSVRVTVPASAGPGQVMTIQYPLV